MNKKIIIILAAVLVLILAAGAFVLFILPEQDTEVDEADLYQPDQWQVDSDDLDDTTLTIYFEAMGNSKLENILKAVNRKLRDELKTELSFKFYWEYPETYLNRIRQDIASGMPCDAFYISSYFPVAIESLAKEGMIMDVSEMFPKYAYQYYSQFTSEDIDALSVNGRVYVIPSRIPGTDRKCAMVRQDLMDKYSIPAIGSYSDYEAFLETIKTNEPNMFPMNYYDTTLGLFADLNGYAVLDYEAGLVYRWDDPEMKIVTWEQTPAFREGLDRIASWYDKGYLIKNLGISQIDGTMVTSGKWASFICSPGQQMEFNSMLRGSEITDFTYKAYPLYDNVSSRTSIMGAGMAVNAKSEQAERVLMFIDWLQSSQENYDLLMYGIKGTDYIEKDGYIEPPEGVSMSESFFNWGWKEPFRNIDLERTNYPGLKEDIQNYNELISTHTKYPPHIGFYPDYSPVIQIITHRKLSFTELDVKIYRGTFEQQDVEKYVDDQKQQGSDRLVKEIQEQLDKYMAEKHGR